MTEISSRQKIFEIIAQDADFSIQDVKDFIEAIEAPNGLKGLPHVAKNILEIGPRIDIVAANNSSQIPTKLWLQICKVIVKYGDALQLSPPNPLMGIKTKNQLYCVLYKDGIGKNDDKSDPTAIKVFQYLQTILLVSAFHFRAIES